jgi:mono/diheme cytochrome c family protein
MRRFALALLVLLAAVALVTAGCSEGDTTATPETVVGEIPTTGGDGACDVPACELQGDATAGKAIFLGASGCGACHTLADAGTTGAVGPNLDDAQPSYERAAVTVTNGRGGMPAFGGQLSDQEIADVSQYIADATAG